MENIMLVDKILSGIKNPSRCAIPEEVFAQLCKTEQFAVWGTGIAGKHAVESCIKRGLMPVCICDSFSHLPNEFIEGVPVISSTEFFDKFCNCTVLISCISAYGIADILKQRGISSIEWDITLMADNFTGGTLDVSMKDNIDKIEEVYNLLADNKSKKTYENVFKYRLTLQKKFLSEIIEKNYYFNNDVVPLIECEVFLDCGAYIGDTLEAFLQSRTCKCDKYYAFEADPENYGKLLCYVKKNQLDKVIPYQLAVFKEKATLMFKATGNACGMISDEGSTKVQADSIDNILYNVANVGYIKMDIEGGELSALYGAKKIIQRDRPILGISIYHHKTDLWEIPLLIHYLNPSYRIYIRHHTLLMADTVCYALPTGDRKV